MENRALSLVGRVPFSSDARDADFLSHLETSLAALGSTRPEDGPGVLRREDPGSECAAGRVAALLLWLLVDGAGVEPDAVLLLPEILYSLNWVGVLQGGWPVFAALAVAVRWSRLPVATLTGPVVFGTARVYRLPPAVVSAGDVAVDPPGPRRSLCDESEGGALRFARKRAAAAWRGAASLAAVVDAVDPVDLLIEAVLTEAKDATNIVNGCWWTSHPGVQLGEALAGVPSPVDEAAARRLCEELEAQGCIGISKDRGGDGTFTLRSGEALLEPSFSVDVSAVRWCHGVVNVDDDGSVASWITCPLPETFAQLSKAARLLRHGEEMVPTAMRIVDKVHATLFRWTDSVGVQVLQGEAWDTEWPVWTLLGLLEQRLALVRSSAMQRRIPELPPSVAQRQLDAEEEDEHLLPLQQPAWAAALQRALGFSDLGWRLVTEDLEALAEKETAAQRRGDPADATAIPETLRESVQCMDMEQCSGEFLARLQLLLLRSERWPFRDPLMMGPQDPLAHLHLRGMEQDPLLSREERDVERVLLESLVPNEHPLQVDRRQIARFVMDVREAVGIEPLAGRCIEWDEPFFLDRAFRSTCPYRDVFTYSEPNPDDPMMGLPGRRVLDPAGMMHYWGDLGNSDLFGIEPETFALILCPFVFEHVAKPFSAMRTLANTLVPGGFIIWAAPMFQAYHGAPHDYFRYTPNGARALAADAGLEVLRLYAPGDFGLVTGLMSGMLSPYWSTEDMLKESPPMSPEEDSPRHPNNVFMLLRKPLSV